MTTVLIVDDEARILAALRRSLRREGWKILTAESPAEALRLLDERSVDLVLSDHKMPGMTGSELLREVAGRWPSIVRILITGWSDAVTDREVREIGIGALIPKPWDDAELKATLHRHLDG
jgi:response regulator RpfG family c-di-GMP phosphodiesterase